MKKKIFTGKKYEFNFILSFIIFDLIDDFVILYNSRKF